MRVLIGDYKWQQEGADYIVSIFYLQKPDSVRKWTWHLAELTFSTLQSQLCLRFCFQFFSVNLSLPEFKKEVLLMTIIVWSCHMSQVYIYMKLLTCFFKKKKEMFRQREKKRQKKETGVKYRKKSTAAEKCVREDG